MRTSPILAAFCALTLPLFGAAEPPAAFVPALVDPLVGDWQNAAKPGGIVAQVIRDDHGDYQANLLRQFDAESNHIATLRGVLREGRVSLRGDGWTGVIASGNFTGNKDGESFNLAHITRGSPTLGAKPPTGAVVLFDGHNLDAWAKKKGKEWLTEDGPAPWKVVAGGAMEVVPNSDCIITKRKFGDAKIHGEFRTLGKPTNSGLYLQTRYEVNINETYGSLQGTPCGGLDNCTPATAKPRVRAARPPLEWQTLDVEFRAPRFDAAGNKTAGARATVALNGVILCQDQELNPPKGAATRLGEAATGPLMLQDHGHPIQFRNVWVVEKSE